MSFARGSVFSALLAIIYIIQAACSSGGGGDAPPVAPTVTTASLNQADANVPLNTPLSASGTGPLTWQLVNAGTLPAGVTLQSSGILTGTPTQDGQFPFTVRVTGPGGTTTKDLKLTILGTTYRASVVSATSSTNPLGEANGGSGDSSRSFDPATSGNGRFVVFDSAATNLVPGLASNKRQVYLYDRQTGLTEMISVSSAGAPGNDDSIVATVSDDGNIVVFDSFASNLVPSDTNNARDVFIRNRAAGATNRISQFINGNEGICIVPNPDCNAFDPSISADGAIVAFGSLPRLTPDDTDNESDIYMYTNTGSPTLTRISAGVGGTATGLKGSPSVSADGKFVAFASAADNMVTGDTVDGLTDIYLYQVDTKTLRKVSNAFGGGAANGNSFGPSISQDGRFVAFWSEATNITNSTDSNGKTDILVADMSTNPPSLDRIVNLNLVEGDGDNRAASISRDGKVIAFDSLATNLDITLPDMNGVRDIYVIDRSCSTAFGGALGSCTLKRVSVASDGNPSNGESRFPALSGDGKYVAYYSDADNLVPGVGGDNNGVRDAFVTRRP